MSSYEFRVVPAPETAQNIKDQNPPSDPNTATVEKSLNRNSRDGWAFVQAQTMSGRHGERPQGEQNESRDLLIFRRDREHLTRPIPDQSEIERVRARRVKRQDVVDLVRAGGRRIYVGPRIKPAE